MRTLARPRGWLVAPVIVVLSGSGVLAYQFFSAGHSDRNAHVLGLSVKPAAAGGNGNGNNGNGNGNNGPGNPAKTFAVSGSVSGLTPTVTTELPLRLQNPNNQAILVQSLTATATGGTSDCPNSLLLLGSGATPSKGSVAISLRIAAGGHTNSSAAPLDPQFPVKLSADAPDICHQFMWTLTYSGTAVQG